VFTFEAHDTQVDVELDNGWNPFSPTLDIHHYSQEAFWQKPFEHIYIYISKAYISSLRNI
jgi:hypothetical protein